MLLESRMNRKVDRLNKIIGILEANGGEMLFGKLKNNYGFQKEELHSLVKEFPQHLEIMPVPTSEKGGRPGELLRSPQYLSIA